MTEFLRNRNPCANVFLMVNLGCEMIFVIDQRLKAQRLPQQKAEQVIHDVLRVVLEAKFLAALMEGCRQSSCTLLSPDNCKFMLHDMARSSPLMSLNSNSMNRLWQLITVVHKWQLHLTTHSHHLLEVTFRHLEAIETSLYSNISEGGHEIIRSTKERFLDFWASCSDDVQESTYSTVKWWLSSVQGKVTLLVRLGFQSAIDGTFLTEESKGYLLEFRDNIGENIYKKCAQLYQQCKQPQQEQQPGETEGNCVRQLERMLHLTRCPQVHGNDINSYQLTFLSINDDSFPFDLTEDTNVLSTMYNRESSSH